MKKLLASVGILSLVASQATAGGLEEPVVQAVEGVEEERSSVGWIIPLVAIAAVALIASSGDDDEDEEEEEIVDPGPITKIPAG